MINWLIHYTIGTIIIHLCCEFIVRVFNLFKVGDLVSFVLLQDYALFFVCLWLVQEYCWSQKIIILFNLQAVTLDSHDSYFDIAPMPKFILKDIAQVDWKLSVLECTTSFKNECDLKIRCFLNRGINKMVSKNRD